MSRTNAFIFDLDGTLVDSLADITSALNHALTQLRQPRVDSHQVKHWIGDGLPTLCQRALPQADPSTIEKLVRLTKEYYLAHCTEHTRPYPNILQMLDLLQSSRAPMAVLSNKPHALTVQVVNELGLSRFFAEVRGYVGEQDKKPSPDAALELASKLAVKPSDVFLVGDSVVDVTTAHHAGMIAVAVTWGFQSREELQAGQPHCFVDDPLEIPGLLQKFRPDP